MTQRAGTRLLVVGWDAADWLVIDALFARNQLPNLRRLVDAGARADLQTLEPRLSPLLWTTIATGKTADKHGILNFIEPEPTGAGVRVASSTSRRTKALWNILSQAGKRVNVVGWYASHPAEPISGTVVSNLFQEGEPADPNGSWPLQAGTVHPAEHASRLAARRVHALRVPSATLAEVLPSAASVSAALPATDDRVRTLAKQVARASSVHAAALDILAADQNWDCTMVFYDAIDTIGHHFMQYRPPRMAGVSAKDEKLLGPVMDNVYRWHDRMLGELLQQSGAGTNVLLMSDHGFYSDHRRPFIEKNAAPEERAALESSWHRSLGVLVLSGPGVATGRPLAAPTLLDIAPTALALLGVAKGADMPGRVLSEALNADAAPTAASPGAPTPAAGAVVPSWDDLPGEAGLHPESLRQDPFEARDAVKQLVELGYMPDLGADESALLDLTRRETQFNLAVVYMTTARHALAIPVFAQLAQELPDEKRYALSLAQCQTAIGAHEDAVATARAFLARHPTAVEAQCVLAASLINAGRVIDAAPVIAALEASCKSRPELARTLGDLCAGAGQWEAAKRHYDRAATNEPSDPTVHVARSRVALAKCAYEEAAEHCLTALELKQALPEGHYLLGVALAWLGELEHAVTSFKLALQWEPRMVDAHRFLARVLERQGDAAAAAEHERAANALLERAMASGGGSKGVAWDADAWQSGRVRAS